MKFIKRWWIAFIFIFMFELSFSKGYVKTEIIIRDKRTSRVIYRCVKIKVAQKNYFEKDTLTIIKKWNDHTLEWEILNIPVNNGVGEK